ncbi:MAG: acyltransferase [Candidatus Electrothrix communis]|nr:MAG: acyltransferase [Candidatus Electrothrix communis]
MLNHITIMRSVAVAIVLIFHFNNKLLISGHIGVDIFFVISGYLISLISLKRINGVQSLKKFYIKRIMRIYPALLFVALTVIFSLSLIEYLEVETLQMFRDTIAFTSNFKAEKINLDYFGDNNNNYLLHFWSIAIELQFYIFFPLLMLSNKIKKYILPVTIGLVALSTLTLSLNLSYYHSLGRILAFSSGALAYLLSGKVKPNNSIFFTSLLSLVLLSFVDLDITTYPNYHNIAVVSLAMIALLFGDIGTEKRYKPFIFIGLISYSIYLWHYPLFLFFHHCGTEPNILNISLLITTVLVLSFFSYSAIERKFAAKNYGNYSILFIILPLALLLLIVYYKKNRTIDIPIINSFYAKMTLNPLLYYSDMANLNVSNKYKGCLNRKGELVTNCSSTKTNNKTRTALVLGNSFVRSGGLILLDQITAHYNVKSSFYYVFGDKIKTDKLYQTIIEEKYDYLILYYPWLGATRDSLIEEYKELSEHTQIIFVQGAKYNNTIDKKQTFRFNNLFVDDKDNAFKCIVQKPYTTDKGYAVIDSVLNDLNAKSINIYELQKNNNGDYICSHDNIALFLDTFHINNYAGEFFAQRFIEADLGRDIFSNPVDL